MENLGKKPFKYHLFQPLQCWIWKKKLADATTDSYEIIKNTGTVDYTESLFQLDVQQVNDSALVRVIHNWVQADGLKTPNTEIKRISPLRYWLVQGIFPNGFNAKGKFYFDRTNSLDGAFLPIYQSIDSLVLLYRKNTADDWHIVNFVSEDDGFTG